MGVITFFSLMNYHPLPTCPYEPTTKTRVK
jgi:hypothetical protein